MRILGIDYGRKRIGVAVSDAGLLSAHALTTLANNGGLLDQLRRIIAEYEPEVVVVGIPFSRDGSAGPMALEADKFRLYLAEQLSVETAPWDESLSSFAAASALHEAGLDSRQQRGMSDGVAAAVILQDYLDAKHAAGAKGGAGGVPDKET